MNIKEKTLMGIFKKKAPVPPEEVDLSAIDRESKYKIFSPQGDRFLKIVLTVFALSSSTPLFPIRSPCKSCAIPIWASQSAWRS